MFRGQMFREFLHLFARATLRLTVFSLGNKDLSYFHSQ